MLAVSEYIPKNDRGWMRPFFLIWTGQAFSILGSVLVQFALVWYLTKTTNSAYVLTTATLAAFLPEVLISPFAGALVDRWNRRRVMMLADTFVGLATFVLLLLFAFEKVQIWHIYVVMFARSVGGIFHWTAMQSSTSLMVPKKHLARINGMNQALHGGLKIIGPVLGALMLEFLPIYMVLAVDVATVFPAILPLFFIPVPQPPRANSQPVSVKGVLADIGAGLGYMRRWKGMMLMLAMAVVINFLLTPTSTLLPLLVYRHFDGTAWHLSAVESAVGLGVILGGLLLMVWGGTRRKIHTTFMGLFGIGASMLLVAAAPANAFWMLLVGVGMSGFMNPITNGPIFAIVQSKVRPEMQGRVFTLISSMAALATPLSMIVAGPVAELIRIQSWYWLAGIGSLTITALMILSPDLHNIEDQSDPSIMEGALAGKSARFSEG